MSRKLTLPDRYARALTLYRRAMLAGLQANGADYVPALAREPRVHLERLEFVEENLGHRVPDFVIAWLAAGLGSEGKWGAKKAPGIHYVEGLTLEWRDSADDSPQVNFDIERYAAFDYDNANYFLYQIGDPAPVIHYFDHEGGFFEVPFVQDPIEMLDRWMADTDASMRHLDACEPFSVTFFNEPLDFGMSPDPDVGRSVGHPKLGKGTITKRLRGKEPKFVVDFEEHGERKLLGRFLEFGE